MTRTVRIELAAVLAVVLALLGFSRLRGHEDSSPAVEELTAGASEAASRDATPSGSGDAPSVNESAPPPGSLPRFGGGRAPRGSEGSSTESQSGGSGGAASARGGAICDPLITDPKGDVDEEALDILEASMTYEASRNTLVVREVFDDIPDSSVEYEELFYEFWFNLDGIGYGVLASNSRIFDSQAATGEWIFRVARDDRTRDGGPHRIVMEPTGRVDTQADTVTIEIDVDEFNRGERAASNEEGLPPAAELRRGSTLTNVYLQTLHLYTTCSSDTCTPSDRANGCSYVVPEP